MKSKLLFYSSLIGLSIQAHAIDLEVYAGRDNKPVNVTAKGNGFEKRFFEENNYGLKGYIDPLPHNIQLGLGLNASSTNSHFGFNNIPSSLIQTNYLRTKAYSLTAQALWKPIPYIGINLSTGLINREHALGTDTKGELKVFAMGVITRFEVSGEYPINDWTIALAVGVESENVKGPLITGDGGSELSVVDHTPMQYGASLGVRYTIPWPNSKPKNNEGLDEPYQAPEAATPVWDEEEVNNTPQKEAETQQDVETGPTQAEREAAELKAQKEQAARDAEVAAWEEEDRLEREAKEAQRIAREKAWEESQRKEAVKEQNSELSEDNDYQWD